MEVKKFDDLNIFWDYANEARQTRTAFETNVMKQHQHEQAFALPGYCLLCEKETGFLVDRQWGAQETPDGWMPNWRERLVCPECDLNNRQRAILYVIKSAIASRGPQPVVPLALYAMEQITPTFRWLQKNLPHVRCIGSEYMSDDLPSGTIVNKPIRGIRHENAEALSFADRSFDFISTNDVLARQPTRRCAFRDVPSAQTGRRSFHHDSLPLHRKDGSPRGSYGGNPHASTAAGISWESAVGGGVVGVP